MFICFTDCIVRLDMVWCDVVWYGMVWYGMVCYGVVFVVLLLYGKGGICWRGWFGPPLWQC